MTKLTRTSLALCIASLVIGGIVDFSGIQVNSIWDAALPLGAVFLGGFVIFLMMENEMADFDREEAEKFMLAGRSISVRTPGGERELAMVPIQPRPFATRQPHANSNPLHQA